MLISRIALLKVGLTLAASTGSANDQSSKSHRGSHQSIAEVAVQHGSFHVRSGRAMAVDERATDSAQPTMLNSAARDIAWKDGKVYVIGDQVTMADVAGTTGVSSVTDTIVLPSAQECLPNLLLATALGSADSLRWCRRLEGGDSEDRKVDELARVLLELRHQRVQSREHRPDVAVQRGVVHQLRGRPGPAV